MPNIARFLQQVVMPPRRSTRRAARWRVRPGSHSSHTAPGCLWRSGGRPSDWRLTRPRDAGTCLASRRVRHAWDGVQEAVGGARRAERVGIFAPVHPKIMRHILGPKNPDAIGPRPADAVPPRRAPKKQDDVRTRIAAVTTPIPTIRLLFPSQRTYGRPAHALVQPGRRRAGEALQCKESSLASPPPMSHVASPRSVLRPRLHRGHFCFLRGVVQGLSPRTMWCALSARCLNVPEGI